MYRKLTAPTAVLGGALLWCSLVIGSVTELNEDDTTTFVGSPDCYPDLRRHVAGLACEERGEPERGYFFLRFRKPPGGAVDIAHLAALSSSRLCGGDGAYHWLEWDERKAAVHSRGGTVEDTVYLEATVRCVWLDDLMEQLHQEVREVQ